MYFSFEICQPNTMERMRMYFNNYGQYLKDIVFKNKR